MRLARCGWILIILVGLPTLAQAQPASPPAKTAPPAARGAAPATAPPATAGPATPEDMTPPAKPRSLSHRYQVGLEAAVGLGFSLAVTYQDTTYCGARDAGGNESFCWGMAPVSIDLGLSFGVLHALDILAEVRIGAMGDLVKNRPLMIMPGVRIWIDSLKAFKIGLALQLVVDLTKQQSQDQETFGLPEKGTSLDLGGRMYAQFQYDFLRYVGIFARVGGYVTAIRWIQANLELQLGVQARFP